MFNPIEDLKNKVEDTKQKIERFSDYKITTVSRLPFEEPNSEAEEALCKKAKRSNIIGMSVFLAIAIVFMVAAIVLKFDRTGMLIAGFFIVIAIVCLITTILSKPKVCRCKVATTTTMITTNSKGKTQRKYTASVYMDEPKKIIAHGANISRRQYDRISDDDEVIIVKAVAIKLYEIK